VDLTTVTELSVWAVGALLKEKNRHNSDRGIA